MTDLSFRISEIARALHRADYIDRFKRGVADHSMNVSIPLTEQRINTSWAAEPKNRAYWHFLAANVVCLLKGESMTPVNLHNDPTPLWMSFKRDTLAEAKGLAVYLLSRGISLYNFIDGTCIVHPLDSAGKQVDYCMLTAYAVVPTLGEFFDKLGMEPDADQLAGMAERYPGKDWRTVTALDALESHTQQCTGLGTQKL